MLKVPGAPWGCTWPALTALLTAAHTPLQIAEASLVAAYCRCWKTEGHWSPRDRWLFFFGSKEGIEGTGNIRWCTGLLLVTPNETADDQCHWKAQFLFKQGVWIFSPNQLSGFLHNELGSAFSSKRILYIKTLQPQPRLKLTSKIPTNLPNVPFTPAYGEFKEKRKALATAQDRFPHLLCRSSSFRTGSKHCNSVSLRTTWSQEKRQMYREL